MKHKVFQYIFADFKGQPPYRVVTTKMSPRVAKAYAKSQVTHDVVFTEPDKHGNQAMVWALDTGEWVPALLIHRALAKGINVKVVSHDLDNVRDWVTDDNGGFDLTILRKKVGMVNFAYANASSAFFVYIEGYDGFDLRPLGIEIENGKKLAKRMNELMRYTAHYVYSETGATISIREFKTPPGDNPIKYDGINFIRASFAKRLGFKLPRGNMRATTHLGLIKGDCIVVPDSLLDVDILYHTDNLKTEWKSTGFRLVTVMKHDPWHKTRHNDQVRGNFPFFIPLKTVAADLERVPNTWKTSLKEGGELYDFLGQAEVAYDDPIALDMNLVDNASRLEEQRELLRANQIPEACLSNNVYTRLGALHRKMNAHRVFEKGQKTSSFRRMFIPAGNAFSGAVVTYEALTIMAGITFPDKKIGEKVYPGEDGTRTFFHKDYGIVIPGDRFVATYDLKGGHDLDDVHSMFDIKVYCTNADKLAMLVAEGVVDPNLAIPDNPDDAVRVALSVRNPNGPGEYSIESVAESMPYAFVDESTIGTFDLARAPLPERLVYKDANPVELKSSVEYHMPFDREFAVQMILAQTQNKGVGPFANVIMAAAAVFGPNSIPNELLLLKMEEAVDTVMQEADLLKFTAIANATQQMWIAFRDIVLRDRVPVDAGLIGSKRIPPTIKVAGEDVPIGNAIVEAKLLVRGPNRMLHRRYGAIIEELIELSKDAAHESRGRTNVAQNVLKMNFGPDLEKFAEGYITYANPALRAVDKELNDVDEDEDEDYMADSTYQKRTDVLLRRLKQLRRRIAMEEKMDELVDGLVENDRYNTHLQILAVYQAIIRRGREIDRIIVQPGTPGHTSMLRLFIEAVNMFELTRDVS